MKGLCLAQNGERIFGGVFIAKKNILKINRLELPKRFVGWLFFFENCGNCDST